MKTLKEKQDEEFDKIFPCIQQSCDNNGTIPERDEEGDCQPAQCEFCYRVRFPVKEFIAKVRKETAEFERERILKAVENPKFEDKIKLNKDSMEYWRGFNNCIEYIKSRIKEL